MGRGDVNGAGIAQIEGGGLMFTIPKRFVPTGAICEMEGVREYCDGWEVFLSRDKETGRLTIEALNEGSYCSTTVDLLDILDWVKSHPEMVEPPPIDTDPTVRA